jgi:serine/threonine-protein kinase HipA
LELTTDEVEEQFRRMVFNVIARNQDDHVKNIAFLMDRAGRWRLAPAFDVTYSFNPDGAWTSTHQMTVNGKRDGFTLEDIRACGRAAQMKRGRAEAIFMEVRDAVLKWPGFAQHAQIPEAWSRETARSRGTIGWRGRRRELPYGLGFGVFENGGAASWTGPYPESQTRPCD